MKVFETTCMCRSCSGTGLFSGMAEDKNSAIVCHNCKGTGEGKIRIEYEDFTGRRKRNGIKWVYETNPGIRVGGSTPQLYGGMSITDWESGKKFGKGSENRECTCPEWWYQVADYDKKPHWDDGETNCPGMGAFYDCKYFKVKDKCWKRFDKENK